MKVMPWIILGGAIGSFMRYSAGLFLADYSGVIPLATFVVNTSGSFTIGLLWGLFEKHPISENVRNFIIIAVLGSYTTFSTFSIESALYFHNGEYINAMWNIIANNLIGIAFVFLGYRIGIKVNFINKREKNKIWK